MPLLNVTDLWAYFDPDADQMIPATDLPELMRMVPPPMGVKGESVRRSLYFCMKLPLQSYEGEVRRPTAAPQLVALRLDASPMPTVWLEDSFACPQSGAPLTTRCVLGFLAPPE